MGIERVAEAQGGKHRAATDDDRERLAELARAGLEDSAPEEEFDRITRLARRVLGADAAFVSLVAGDHQFHKSADGVPSDSGRVQPLSESFCKYAVATGDTFVVRDSRSDPLVRHSPAIDALDLVAYAGSPVETASGHVLGTVCVIHHHPHDWTDDQLAMLDDLAALASTEVEYRLRSQEAESIRVLCERLVDPLEGLADAVRSTATLVDIPGDPRLPRTVDSAVQRLRTVETVTGDLRTAIARSGLTGPSVNLSQLLDRALALVGAHSDNGAVEVVRPEHEVEVQARMALHRPIASLLQAAVQNLGDDGRCRVEVAEEGAAVTLTVSSPGAGLPNATLLRLVSKFTAADTGDDPARTEAAAVHRQGGRTVVEHGAVRAENGPGGFELSVRLVAVDSHVHGQLSE